MTAGWRGKCLDSSFAGNKAPMSLDEDVQVFCALTGIIV